jgi:kynurenine 3-monooxygenase
LFRKKVEARIAQLCPGSFVPKYTMVTFSHLPYREALRRGLAQDAVLDHVCGLPNIESRLASVELEPMLRALVEPLVDPLVEPLVQPRG